MSTYEPGETVKHPSASIDGAVDTSVFIEYYTDPLCSWSWAFEPQWRSLRYHYSGHLNWRYRMGGLIPNWQSYHDPFNDIGNPAQMAPQWLQVREVTGMPFDERIWTTDPPSSSYPACLAVKAAERQGQTIVEHYLRRLREAVMIERRNISRQDILLAIAKETSLASLSDEVPLDLDRFTTELDASETLEAFRQDLRDASYYGVVRFPTLVLHRADGRGIVLIGYRPYEVLQTALQHLVPELHQNPEPLSQEKLAIAYVTHWQRVTEHELAEFLGSNVDQLSTLLQSLITRNVLTLAPSLPHQNHFSILSPTNSAQKPL